MRFLPVFLDLQSRPGAARRRRRSGAGEIAPVGAAGARSAGSRPMAIRMLSGLDPAEAARIELALAIRLPPICRRNRDPLRRRGRCWRCDVGAGQGVRPACQRDGRSRAFDLHLSGDRRSRRCGRRCRHRRRLAGGGATRARAHRGGAAGAHRRSRRFHRPLAQIHHGRIPEFPLRRRFWERVVDGPIGALVLAGRKARPKPR